MSAADGAVQETERRMKERSDDGASGMLVTATLCALLAMAAWYIAVERPRLDSVESLHTVVQEMRRIQDRDSSAKRNLEPDGKDANYSEIRSLVMNYRKEMDAKVLRIKTIVEDGQRQQVEDKKMILEKSRAEASALRALEAKMAGMEQEIAELRALLDGAQRLERAAEALTNVGAGRVASQEPLQTRNGGGPAASNPTRQAATGGLVELREGDFDKLLREGDAWVVMFYAPWCAHCKAAELDFQQAGLQAGVHFARLDAIKHSDVAEQEQVTGFPTFKAYVGGRMVKQYQGDRTVTGFLNFAKEIEVLHY